ncbi:hypothetical protein SCUCBS95973_009811 [Sporothrix curviconia]|uniref:C3H1-type domain-containing protein n=1 Tax=Sporothrix curviconia TaxID=1260050 RepID=A0ABP0CY11_9PEZI
MAARVPAPALRAGTPPEECNVFIDDSNIWIEAQKYAASGNSHMPKLTDADQDPRLRIDVGRMVTLLLRGRKQGESNLYGSRPPPNDAVWEAVEKYNFKTNIFARGVSRNGGRLGTEKGVDASMVRDITKMAMELNIMAKMQPEPWAAIKDQRTFICVTGDRDFLTTIEDVLKMGIHVELWAWRSGLASAYRQLDDEQRKTPGATPFEVNFLDDVFQDVYFTNYYSTHRDARIDPAKAVVLLDFADEWREATGEAGSTDGGPIKDEALVKLEKKVCIEMQNMGRLFYVTKDHGPGKTMAELVLIFEFPHVRDLEATLLRIRRAFAGLATVVSWREYKDLCETRKHTPQAMPDTRDMITTATAVTTTLYAPLNSDTAEVNETEDSEWTVVSRTNPSNTHRRNMVRQEQCPPGVHCDKASHCTRQHTDHERWLFRELPRQNFRYYKTQRCKHYPHCSRGMLCTYAHDISEAWCLVCKVNGHFKDGCKFASQREQSGFGGY